jgi:DNA repair protein RadA/Sms
MAKSSPLFTCSKCDAQFPKWSGRCSSCGAWGTLGESDPTSEPTKKVPGRGSKAGSLKAFADDGTIVSAKLSPTGIGPLDLVLAGGLVNGSVTLMAGEPGIGKSTLLAQTALKLAQDGKKVVYVTGEESPAQVRRRLERLSKQLPATLLFLDETDAGVVAATIEKEKPEFMIVDSIQSISTEQANGESGSVSQVKASAAIITEAAKQAHVPVFLVGQVTKEGDVAGPRVLEHLVDTVLFLEGDAQHRYRILRALKHRFGPTDETAVLTMTERGLEAVEDPSQELLKDRAANIPGSAISCLLEGHRPLLIELQALVSPAGYGTPVRRATGIDSARLGILLAVLARRTGVHALDKDVYANAAGGIDARDPSADLALGAAIASAVTDRPLDPRLGLIGEVGLAGELRPIGMPELRLKEFQRMGFSTVILPKGQGKHAPKELTIHEVGSLFEALKIAGLR